jgi:hypothetical protein
MDGRNAVFAGAKNCPYIPANKNGRFIAARFVLTEPKGLLIEAREVQFALLFTQ